MEVQETKIKQEKKTKVKKDYQTSFRQSLISNVDNMIVLDRGVKWNGAVSGAGNGDNGDNKKDKKDKKKE